MSVRTKNNQSQSSQSTNQSPGQQHHHEDGAKIPNPLQGMFKGRADGDGDGIDDRERKLLKLLQFVLLAAMGYFIISNVRPYLDIVDRLFFLWQDTGIFKMLAQVPILGWLLNGGVDVVKFGSGLLLWSALQLLELLPTIMNHSPKILLRSLLFIRSWRKVESKDGDSQVARMIRQRYNSIPEQTIERANTARAVAYILDAAICIWFFCPIEGGWENLSMVLTASAWDYINWGACFDIAMTLFAVEIIYGVHKMVTDLVTIHFQNN